MNYSFFEENKIIPVIKIEKAEDIVDILDALAKGGINIAEITFRTECAAEAIKLAVKKFPNMIIGAGTVINAKQCSNAIAAGAKFIVSPGYLDEIGEVANKSNIPYIPGVITPTEIMTAYKAGYSVLKFFPCQEFGGIDTINAFSNVFPQVKFVPTGGINQDNFKRFLKHHAVIAVGGTWILKGDISKAAANALKELKN